MENKNHKEKSIVVVGLWHLGSVYAASLAKMGFKVTGYDFNEKTIADLNEGTPPIFEPNLQEYIKEYSNNLKFSFSCEVLKGADYVFITHDLTVDENDIVQTEVLTKTFSEIAEYSRAETSIVISSQAPVGSSRQLVDMLKKKGITDPRVICFPENLRLGTAFDSFLKPDRIIVGSDSEQALEDFKKDLGFDCPIITMGLESAEMVKHALNGYLATCISLSSELSDIAENVGADMNDVVKALKSDRRVSQFAPLSPGLGFAGGTLGRDVQSLRNISKKYGEEAKLMTSVYSVNQDRIPHLVSKIKTIYPDLRGMKIGILGLTYKANTNTLRRSMSLALASVLDGEGVDIRAYDPAIKETVAEAPYIQLSTNTKEFFTGLDMAVLMTDWQDFLKIDSGEVGALMANAVIVDTKNFLDSVEYKKNRFKYFGVGIQ